MNPTQPQTQLDPQALNLAKAIRKAETGTTSDPYNAKGASGESGAYQFMPDTWKQWAGQYLQNPNADMSVENQNKVAYSHVKELKDQGYNPSQIASSWNSGDKEAYKGTFSNGKPSNSKAPGGKPNSKGIDYDVPAYAKKVSQYYNELKNGGQPNPVGDIQQGPSDQAPQTGGLNPMQGVQTMDNQPPAPVSPDAPTPPDQGATGNGFDLGNPIANGILDFVAPILSKRERTPGQWAGDAALTALNVIPGAGILGKLGINGIKGAVDLARGAKTLSSTAKAAKAAEAVTKSTLSVKNIAKGAGLGYGYDVASHLAGGDTNTSDVLAPGIGTILGAGGGALARSAPKAEVDKAARDLIPELSFGKSINKTGKTGLEKTGVLGNVSQPITKDVYSTTEAVMQNVPNFNKLGTYTEKLNAVNEANRNLADTLTQEITKNGDNVIYPFKELSLKMKSIQPSIQIRADNTQMRQYKLAQEAALKMAQDNGGKISGLFQARKDFDGLVEKEFPTLYDRENAPMRQAITDIRNAMNSTIEDSLKGRGMDYSGSLKQQARLFSARDALAAKAYKEVGTNAVGRFVQNHPYATGALKYILPPAATATGVNYLSNQGNKQ